ncbi:MAG: hypothetical protein JO296_08425 [Pseudonocardiales bacterium]|nr:hypothetical protein [Pseudonocardiales bacterium]MBV9650150.1 hypothetical protein [Pseudonocardiales bacterium]
MSREMLAAVVLVWVIGALVGWFVGWVARGDESRRWAESFRRRVDYAESQARDAAAELERVKAQRLDQSWVAAPAPQIHVHVQPLPVLGYHDLTGVAAQALAAQLPPVLEVGP